MAVLLLSSLESISQAGGIFVPGAGPVAQGRAGAFVAKADDPTAVSHNPAGFAKLDGTQLYIGSNFLRYVLSYQRSGSYEPGMDPTDYEGQAFPEVENNGDVAIGFLGFQTLPAFAISTDLGHPEWPVRFGFGLYSPQAFPTRSFSNEVTLADGTIAPAPQRYDVVSQNVVLSSPSLIVSYSPTPTLDIGIRGSWGIASLKGSKALWTLRNYTEQPGQDSLFTLAESKDNFVPTMALGFLYRPSSRVEIGGAWNSAGHIRGQGTGASVIGSGSGFGDAVEIIPRLEQDVECAHGGRRGALKACVSADLAQSASLGGRWILLDAHGEERADIELDVKWEQWSKAGTTKVQVDGMVNVTGGLLYTVVNTHGYQDVISTRLGGSYKIDAGGGELELRSGIAYDTRTAPKSWTRVDQDGKRRATFGTGLGFRRGRYRLDLAAGAVWEPDLSVGVCKAPYGPTSADRGCSSTETAVDDRDRPSPSQPLFPYVGQKESPFNAGTYKSHYLMFALGLQVGF